MKSRYLNPADLAAAESRVGIGLEFAPEHDLVNAGKPPLPALELIPVGPPATVYELLPEHDHAKPSTIDKKGALVAAVVGLVREHVTDADRLRAIEAEIAAILSDLFQS